MKTKTKIVTLSTLFFSTFFAANLRAELFLNSSSCPNGATTLSIPDDVDPATGGTTWTMCTEDANKILLAAALNSPKRSNDVQRAEGWVNEDHGRFKKLCVVTVRGTQVAYSIEKHDIMTPASNSNVLCVRPD
jgi:hypothetical protein